MTERHVLTGPIEQARGVIGQYPDRDEEFVFEFDSLQKRTFHMVGVHRPLHVEFIARGETVREETLRPWIGMARERCDTVVESRPAEVGR